MIEFVDNRYGKSRVRVMKVTRHPEGNEVYEWTVEVLLRGDFETAHTLGDNSKILATDTMKNTVYAVARRSSATTPEAYARELIDFLLSRNPQVASAQVQTTSVERAQGGVFQITSGLAGMHVLKTANSGFSGFLRDELTTLPETEDRLFGTVVEANWRYSDPEIDYAATRTLARESLLKTFAGHISKSVQETLYAMAEDLFAAVPAIDEVHILMPNKHCLLADLGRGGMDNPNEIFIPTDEPHGTIEARLRRG